MCRSRRSAAGTGLRNFFKLYQRLADSWQVIDNSLVGRPHMIARGEGASRKEVCDAAQWELLAQWRSAE
jgi:hypothetical protein